MNQKNKEEKEDFDPDIHGGGVENFATFPPEKGKEKDKVIVSEDDGYHD